MNTIFKISWKLNFFELILTKEEYNHFAIQVENCIEKKKHLQFSAKNGTKLILIPYSKLKKGIITFETIA